MSLAPSLAAAANGGDFTDIAASAGIGLVFGAASGATFGAVPAAPAAVALSQFARSAGTGALASAAGETTGQVITGSELDVGKIGTSAIVGATSGMGGSLVQQMGFGSRTSIASGGSIQLLMSPAVAKAESEEIDERK